MLSGRSKKEYAKEAQAAADAPDGAAEDPTPITSAKSASTESDLETAVAM